MIAGPIFHHLIGIILLARITLQASSPIINYYVGAVVEYHPIRMSDNGTATTNENAKNFLKFLQTASEKEVDIIVFPESSLMAGISFSINDRTRYLPYSTYIPDPKDSKVPCHDPSTNVIEAIKDISCAAKRYAIYIVINVHEKEKCTGDKCAKDGHLLYNTNVVFDRTGAVVARYRKWNLFGEPGFNKTTTPELSTFKTDFGVTFGQFICFDLLFQTPALRLLKEKNITDIVFSTYWFSELPYLMANEIQTAWSYANNVNFLGAGYNSPSTGSGGSGIYAGKDGVFSRLWSEKRTNALIIARIPKVINGQRSQPLNPADTSIIYYKTTEIPTTTGPEPVPQQVLKHDDITAYTTQLIQPTNGTRNMTVCDRGLCCHFVVHSEHRKDLVKDRVNYYKYRVAVFNGVRSFSNVRTGGLEICSIIACTDDNLSSCNKRFDTNTIIVQPTTFHSIIISSEFKNSVNVSRMPISLNMEMQPLNISDFTFISRKTNSTHVNLKYSLTKSHKDLMTFAIYGRNFTADGLPRSLPSAASQVTPFYTMLVILMLLGVGKIININSV